MQAAAQIAAVDANESWSSYSELQQLRSVSSMMPGTNHSPAQTLKRKTRLLGNNEITELGLKYS